VTFQPELRRFGMSSLRETDILSLMERRVYDVAACNEGVRVYFNGRLLPGSFAEYVQMLRPLTASPTLNPDPGSAHSAPADTSVSSSPSAAGMPVFERLSERWQVGVGVSDSGQLLQVSFVNSIHTSKGGTHVNYIADQVVDFILERLKKVCLSLTALLIRSAGEQRRAIHRESSEGVISC